jgi:PASTA domain
LPTKEDVAALLSARIWRIALPIAALLLATAGLTSAASNQQSSPASASAAPATTAAAARTILVVPKVRGQAYVFAKGILGDTGFAWRVTGGVDGFPANLVASQSPAPGTRLVDTGAPMITLRLARNGKYSEDGIPENFSPFPGTRVLTPAAAKRRAAAPSPNPKPAAKPKPAAPKQAASSTTAATPKATPKRSASKKPKAASQKPKAAPKPAKQKTTQRVKKSAARPAEFIVPGAPKEPLNEMPLPRRARQLKAWVASHPRPTDANVAHWLYQHAWIVTGAKFGWWRGAEALRILIAADRRVISNWGIGTRSLSTARTTLAEVEAKSR